jgi:hypothetical protein
MALFTAAEEVVAARLREADLDAISPLQALTLLHELRERLSR